ncbi:MAG: mechanosensitive ion channel, partial [Chloroflexi bacterium]|nr:mechanosensitive ion channel [Chloroflexota bacterium]
MEQWLYSLGNQIAFYLPRVISALILLIVAFVVGTIVKAVLTRVLTAARVDERYGKHVTPEGSPPFSLAKTIGNTAFWLIILFFLPAILDALALPGLLSPVSTMINRIFSFLPNIFAAAVIFLVGWFIATIVKRVVTGLLGAAGVDRFSERLGIQNALGSQTLSSLLGTIVYLIILIPVLIAAIDALGIQAITQPATTMLNTVLNAVPNIFAAFVMLAIAFVVGRVIAELVADLLTAMGFNAILERMGLARIPVPTTNPPPQPASARGGAQPPRPATTGTTPARVVGNLVLVAIMLFTAIEAMRLLGFMTLATMLGGIMTLAGQVLLGLVILGIGLYLSNLAYNAILSSGSGSAEIFALAARIAILVLAGSMALRQMGLANEIVDLAFGLLLGAIAVAVALAFGLG